VFLALSSSEIYLVDSLETQDLSCVVGCGWFYSKLTGYARDLGDLFGVALRHSAFVEI
jgi:hypothetical protein